jgi:hypothetical protein
MGVRRRGSWNRSLEPLDRNRCSAYRRRIGGRHGCCVVDKALRWRCVRRVVALAAVPAYVVIFAVWDRLVVARPGFEANGGRSAIVALALALPLALVVAAFYGSPVGSLGPFWREALTAFPFALLGAWARILLARVLIRRARRVPVSVAA